MGFLKRPTTDEEKISFLMATGKGTTRRKAEGILSRGGQFNDLYSSFERGMQKMLTAGMGDTLGDLQNAFNPNAITPMSDSSKQRTLQTYGPRLERSYEYMNNAMEHMERSGANEWLTPEFFDAMNSQVKQIQDLTGGAVLRRAKPWAGGTTEGAEYDALSVGLGTKDVYGMSTESESGPTKPGTPAQRKKVGDYDYQIGEQGESGYQVSQLVGEVTDTLLQRAQQGLQTATDPRQKQVFENIIANYDLQQGKIEAANADGTPAGTPGTAPMGDASSMSALQQLENDPQFQGLPEDLKSLYRQVVGEWDVGAEINMEGVLNKFNDIQKSTIDPYFSEQVIKPFVTDLTNQYANLQAERGRQLETERSAIGENVRQAKASNEKSGMTFTGKAIEDLGAEAAIGQPGAEGSAIPGQDPFATEGGSAYFYEGKVNQANRLMSTGSSERYQRTLQDLGRQAESKLGSQAAGALGIPYEQVGGVTGSIEEQKQQQLASTLSSIAGQNRQNVAQDKPLQYNF